MTDFGADEGEYLEPGYGASTPARDNALLDYARGEADAFAATAAARGGRVESIAALGVRLADTGAPTPFGNTAHLERPIAEAEIPAVTAAVQEFFAGQAGGPFMLFSPWPIADLSDRGFHPVGHPPLMLRAPSVAPLSPKANLRITLVDTEDALADFEQTLVEAYPVPELQPWQRGSFFGPAMLTTSWRLFAGYEGDRCVATAGAWITDSVTIVELVSVRDDCRGKGYGIAITAAATVAVPGAPAMLIASDLGRPAYDKLGYVPILRHTLYLGMRTT